MLAPGLLARGLLAAERRPARRSGSYDLLHPTFAAFKEMWKTIDFERYLINSAIICTVAALLATAFASIRRLRAGPLPLPRRQAASPGRHRHAADPRLDVPAAGLHRLHLAQAAHAGSTSSTRASGMILVYTAFFTPVAIYFMRSSSRRSRGTSRRRRMVDGCTRFSALRAHHPARPPRRGWWRPSSTRSCSRGTSCCSSPRSPQHNAETIPLGIRLFIGNYSEYYGAAHGRRRDLDDPRASSPSSPRSAGWCAGITAGAVKG